MNLSRKRKNINNNPNIDKTKITSHNPVDLNIIPSKKYPINPPPPEKSNGAFKAPFSASKESKKGSNELEEIYCLLNIIENKDDKNNKENTNPI